MGQRWKHTRAAVLTLLIIVALGALDFPPAQGITIETRRGLFVPNDVLYVAGTTRPYSDVTIEVANPFGNLVAVTKGGADYIGKYNITLLRFPSSNTTTFPYGSYTVSASDSESLFKATIYFEPRGLTATASKASYRPNELLVVSGTAAPSDEVALSVTNPPGILVGAAQSKASPSGIYNITVFRFPSSNSSDYPYGKYSIRVAGSKAGYSVTIAINFTAPKTDRPVKWQQVPISFVRIVDTQGNRITAIRSGDLVNIEAKVGNNDTLPHTFTFIVQVKNSDGRVESLAWISEIPLEPGSSLSPGISWRPNTADTYSIEVFVWESFANPLPLSPAQEISAIVG